MEGLEAKGHIIVANGQATVIDDSEADREMGVAITPPSRFS